METQPKTLAAVADLAAKERLEKSLHRRIWKGLSGVRDPELEVVAFGSCPNVHGLVLCSMCESIADQIGRQLPDPAAVAIDGPGYLEPGLNHARASSPDRARKGVE